LAILGNKRFNFGGDKKLVRYVEKSGETIEEAIIILEVESHAEGLGSGTPVSP